MSNTFASPTKIVETFRENAQLRARVAQVLTLEQQLAEARQQAVDFEVRAVNAEARLAALVKKARG
jgi:hypothetical protein